MFYPPFFSIMGLRRPLAIVVAAAAVVAAVVFLPSPTAAQMPPSPSDLPSDVARALLPAGGFSGGFSDAFSAASVPAGKMPMFLRYWARYGPPDED